MEAIGLHASNDVDVAQIYMNMNSMGIGAMIDHGFFTHGRSRGILPAGWRT